MNNNITYDDIKDSIIYSFEEYIEEDGFTVSQSVAKILEEDWRELNYNNFTKTAYYILIAIECLKLKEIPDYIYDKLNIIMKIISFEDNINKNDKEQLIQDINICKKIMGKKDYRIIETTFDTKSRIEYILNLKP